MRDTRKPRGSWYSTTTPIGSHHADQLLPPLSCSNSDVGSSSLHSPRTVEMSLRIDRVCHRRFYYSSFLVIYPLSFPYLLILYLYPHSLRILSRNHRSFNNVAMGAGRAISMGGESRWLENQMETKLSLRQR